MIFDFLRISNHYHMSLRMQLNKYCKSQESNIHNISHAFSIVTIYSAISSLVPGTDLTRAGEKIKKRHACRKAGFRFVN